MHLPPQNSLTLVMLLALLSLVVLLGLLVLPLLLALPLEWGWCPCSNLLRRT